MAETAITSIEYTRAVGRACAECEQEIAAATAEYNDAVRPHAAKRKERGRAARAKRDQRIGELREQLR